MPVPKFLNSRRRFTTNILKHPGTWVLVSLITVGIAFAAPAMAGALVILAGVGIAIATVTLFFPYLWNFFKLPGFWNFLTRPDEKKSFSDWVKAHPFQAATVAVALALFITAFVLTICFFTGGAGFAFILPVFAAIQAPFAVAAASWGISLCLPALAGFCFIIAALNLGNTLKRFLGWLDSFKYDGSIDYLEKEPLTNEAECVANDGRVIDSSLQEFLNGDSLRKALLALKVSDKGAIDWSNKTEAWRKVETVIQNRGSFGYFKTVFAGIAATVKNDCSSRYEEELQKAADLLEVTAVNKEKKIYTDDFQMN